MNITKYSLKSTAITLVFVFIAGIMPLGVLSADFDVTITGSKTVAQNQAEIQAAIDSAPPDGKVTVSGMVSGVDASMTLNIPSGMTVEWGAFYIGSPMPAGGSLINLTGDGIFELVSGWTENTGSGNTVNATGTGTKVIVGGDGTLAANSGDAIYMAGQAAQVVVCGNGSVHNYAINNIRPAIHMYSQNNNGTNVIVKENGSVSSLLDGGTGYAIQTYGNVEVLDYARVFATGGRAINALGAASLVTIDGDSKVWTKSGIVIRTSGAGASVIVKGGEVYNEATSASYPVILLADGLDVAVCGTGKVLAKGNGGRVIETSGSVTVADEAVVCAVTGNAIHVTGTGSQVTISGGKVSVTDPAGAGSAINATSGASITVSGGQVSATRGYAISASSSNASVAVTDGFVFAYGYVPGDVVRNPLFSSSGFGGNGIVVAWNTANYQYSEDTSTDLVVMMPENSACWTVGGISYTNGSNSGFFPISNVIVISYRGGLIFNIEDGKFYRNTDGSGNPANPGNTIYTAQDSNYRWDESSTTLTLNGFNWNSDETDNHVDRPVALWITWGASPAAATNLSIMLERGSVNSFVSICRNSHTTGIFSEASLTITGDGVLEATGSDTIGASTGITCTSDLIIDSGTVIATGGEVTAACDDNPVLDGWDNIGSAGIGGVDIIINGGKVIATGGRVTAGCPDIAVSSGGILCETLAINGGVITATGDTVTAITANDGVSLGILGAFKTTIAGGAITAIGHTYAILTAEFINNEPAYVYWTNTLAADPGGAGTLVYSGGSGAEYTYDVEDGYLCVKITAHPIAFITSKIITGNVGVALTDQSVAITLHDVSVGSQLIGENAASWFNSELPPGVTVLADAESGAKQIMLTFSGMPRAVSCSIFSITIPESALTSDVCVPVQPNVDTKFNVLYLSRMVTFDPNGGAVNPTYGMTDPNSGRLENLPTPTRSSHTFAGWFMEESDDAPVSLNTEFVFDSTIYAHWTPASGGNSNLSVNDDATDDVDDIVVNEPVPFFEDVYQSDWFYADVYYVYINDLMMGTSTTPLLFSPYMSMERGMIATVFHRMEDSPSATEFENPFNDVLEGKYYTDAVVWAARHGIVLGYGNDNYGPEDIVTREQLVAIMYRYSKWKGIDVSIGEAGNISGYADMSSISGYAVPAIQWACGAGVILGRPGGRLDPAGNATRAEFAAMLSRFALLDI